MSFSQETYIDSVLTEEIFQFQLPAAKTIKFPAGQPQSFSTFVLLGRAAIFAYDEENFQGGPSASPPPPHKRGWEQLCSLQWGVRYGTSWRATQRPGHVCKSHAPEVCHRWGKTFGSNRTVGYGLEELTCLTWDGFPGHRRGIRRPTLYSAGLSAGPSSQFFPRPAHWTLGVLRRAQTHRLKWKARRFSFFPQAAAVTYGRNDPHPQPRRMASPCQTQVPFYS
jgi:hypothetical protein